MAIINAKPAAFRDWLNQVVPFADPWFHLPFGRLVRLYSHDGTVVAQAGTTYAFAWSRLDGTTSDEFDVVLDVRDAKALARDLGKRRTKRNGGPNTYLDTSDYPDTDQDSYPKKMGSFLPSDLSKLGPIQSPVLNPRLFAQLGPAFDANGRQGVTLLQAGERRPIVAVTETFHAVVMPITVSGEADPAGDARRYLSRVEWMR